MNINRFLNFGKYDLTINKAFYRNIAFITIFGSVGIAIVAFLLRWNFWGDAYMQSLKDMPGVNPIELGIVNPGRTSFTSLAILGFCSIMTIVYAGHTFHNLRNKQGRITELTMPVTNLERWIWHVLVSTVGGFLAMALSVICADIVNAIFNLIVYAGNVNSSLTLDVIRTMLMIPTGDGDIQWTTEVPFTQMQEHNSAWYFLGIIYASIFSQIGLYIFGNSVKYRYNIIFTYIASQVVETVVAIFVFIFAANFNWKMHLDIQDFESVEVWAYVGYYSIIAFYVLTGCAFLWGSYKMYCKAQISSKWNR